MHVEPRRSGSILHGVTFLILASCYGCSDSRPQKASPITFFAAASTKEPLEQIGRDFQAETGTAVEIVLGPSSALAKQIERGADTDLFLSADEASTDYLEQRKLVEERRPLLSNRLVVIVPAEGRVSTRLNDLRDFADPGVRRVAIAEPGVPAGEYAREALRKAGILKQVQDK